jgi:hypothetical protein
MLGSFFLAVSVKREREREWARCLRKCYQATYVVKTLANFEAPKNMTSQLPFKSS